MATTATAGMLYLVSGPLRRHNRLKPATSPSLYATHSFLASEMKSREALQHGKDLSGFSILSFSLDAWDDVWRSRHHVMSRLAAKNTTMYVDPVPYIDKAFRSIYSSPTPRREVTRVSENLFSYRPPRWLPLCNRPTTLKYAFGLIRRAKLRRTMRRLGMTSPILYLWHPSYADHIGRFGESLVVYHCYDEIASFHSNPEHRDRVLAEEASLCRKADVVFTASEELRRRRLQWNSNTHVIQNGVDYELLSQAQLATVRVPDDIANIGRPIVGCVATQLPFMDVALLLEVFTRRQDWSLVFVGVEPPRGYIGDESLRQLCALKNVHFLGRCPLSSIPGYLKAFSVATIPWILNDVTLVSSSPLKLYEYLAAGKPVVTKPLPLMRHLEGVVSFATTGEEWIAAIEAALREDSERRIQERQQVARANTWDKRVDAISRQIIAALARKAVAG